MRQKVYLILKGISPIFINFLPNGSTLSNNSIFSSWSFNSLVFDLSILCSSLLGLLFFTSFRLLFFHFSIVVIFNYILSYTNYICLIINHTNYVYLTIIILSLHHI